MQSGDPYFDVSLHGETPTRIYASSFTTPPGILKTFVSSALVFGTMYMLLLQIRVFVESLTVGDFKSAINTIDASLNDIYYM